MARHGMVGVCSESRSVFASHALGVDADDSEVQGGDRWPPLKGDRPRMLKVKADSRSASPTVASLDDGDVRPGSWLLQLFPATEM